MKFEEHHAIITGGSSGIGKATAKLLAREGSNITIIARSQSKLDLAKQEIEAVKVSQTQRILAVSADVAQREQIKSAIDKAITELGCPDYLITCAGIAHPGHFQELPLEIFEDTMAINYFGTLYSIKAVLSAMEERRQGHVVIISSGAGLIGIYGYTPYSPSKFALRGLGESLRGELKPLGINISIVYPPDTDTPQLVAENKTKPLATKMITASAETWSADAVAREILQGIEKKQFAICSQSSHFVIAPGLEMKLLNRLHSLILPLINWYFDRLVIKANYSLGDNHPEG